MGLKLITPVNPEPVTLTDIKAALRVNGDTDDAMLTGHIRSAREFIERRIQSKIGTQTWDFVIDAFPAHEIKLPFGPVQSITSIKYDDAEGIETTVDPETYQLDNTSRRPWVFTTVGWPTPLDTFNAVRIRFVAGYDDMAMAPSSLSAAITLKTKELYDGEDTAEAVNNLLINHLDFGDV
jgi:uncharacterized phiE125 gp8 family phage protein